MIPQGLHPQLYSFALTAAALIANQDTPKLLRRRLRKLYRKLKKKMPAEALREIEAAEAEATIKAAYYLRVSGLRPDSCP